MKRLHLLILAGGLLAGIAFFLPFALSNPEAGIFSSGDSLKEKLNYTLSVLGVLKIDQGRIFLGYVATFLEPAGVILLLLGGLVALKLRRAGALCGLCGALLGLMPLVWLMTFLYGFYQGVGAPFSLQDFEYLFRGWGSGYWLAIIGFVLGLVGALAVWLERLRLPMDQPRDRTARRIRPGALLALCGGLVVAVGMFVVPFFSSTPQENLYEENLFGLWSKPFGFAFLWAVPLVLLLLLASGLIAFMGKKAAYLGSLVGALVGLVFLLLILSPVFVGLQGVFSDISIGAGSWLLLIGCALGLIGAVLGLLERPASPVPAEMQMAPLPS
ncbi:MAG TPA: hypothetical protein VKT82_11245 [Ktedonobacterales bacterium]|nr:hypothetical protein [Ktedonobacterales bacterium]